jgi:type 1 glutamine amidotransferase
VRTGHANPIDVLVVTGGHPFEAEPFFALFDALDGIEWTAADQPTPGHDVVVFYDMPGLRFTGGDPPVDLVEPTAEQRAVFDDLCAAGCGLVFLHHAIASWPAWEGFAELVGGRFHYQPAELRGVSYPDSGYRFDVTHSIEVLDPDHPVCAGLGTSFTLTDELYCCPILNDSVTPLMRTDYDTADPSNFYSSDLAIRGRRNTNEGWTHPPGGDLVAWTREVDRSKLVYLQFGDGPQTYADPSFRRALHNAIGWTAATA